MGTTLVPRPFYDLGDIRSRLDRMIEDLVGRPDLGSWAPATDIRQADGKLELTVDVPGLEPEDVKVRVSEGVLTVSGEHHIDREEAEEGGYLRRERRGGAFYRSLRLPAGADVDAIDATVKHGVATITVPVAGDGAAPTREIAAKAG